MAFGHLPNRRRRRRRTSLCKISFDARDRIVELRNVDQGISLLHLLGTTTTMFRFLPRIIVGPIFFTRVDFKKKKEKENSSWPICNFAISTTAAILKFYRRADRLSLSLFSPLLPDRIVDENSQSQSRGRTIREKVR